MASNIDRENHCLKFRVDKKFPGKIVCQGGATLRGIRERTNTRVRIPPESCDSDVIVIIGRHKNVEKSRRRIFDILNQMASERPCPRLP